MKAKHTDLEKLEQLYKESGNQLVVLYGRRGCQKEELIKEFCDGKKFFYYRCRQASPEHQLEMMGEEISTTKFGHVKLNANLQHLAIREHRLAL